jgi:hypothetical protein
MVVVAGRDWCRQKHRCLACAAAECSQIQSPEAWVGLFACSEQFILVTLLLLLLLLACAVSTHLPCPWTVPVPVPGSDSCHLQQQQQQQQ